MNRYVVLAYRVGFWLMAWLICTAVQAQTAATAPAHADVKLSGQFLAARNVASQAACQSQCQQTAGCTAYTFWVAGEIPAKERCVLYAGTTTEMPARGAVSCAMPCTAALVSPHPIKEYPPLKLNNPPTVCRTPPCPPPVAR